MNQIVQDAFNKQPRMPSGAPPFAHAQSSDQGLPKKGKTEEAKYKIVQPPKKNVAPEEFQQNVQHSYRYKDAKIRSSQVVENRM